MPQTLAENRNSTTIENSNLAEDVFVAPELIQTFESKVNPLATGAAQIRFARHRFNKKIKSNQLDNNEFNEPSVGKIDSENRFIDYQSEVPNIDSIIQNDLDKTDLIEVTQGQPIVSIDGDKPDFAEDFELQYNVGIEVESSKGDSPEALSERIRKILADPTKTQDEKQAYFYELSKNRNLTDHVPDRFSLDNILGRRIKVYNQIKQKSKLTKEDVGILAELDKQHPDQKFLQRLSPLKKYQIQEILFPSNNGSKIQELAYQIKPLPKSKTTTSENFLDLPDPTDGLEYVMEWAKKLKLPQEVESNNEIVADPAGLAEALKYFDRNISKLHPTKLKHIPIEETGTLYQDLDNHKITPTPKYIPDIENPKYLIKNQIASLAKKIAFTKIPFTPNILFGRNKKAKTK